MAVQVKICGLTTKEAVNAAVEAGANFAGFVDHATSSRHIPVDKMAALIALLPASMQSVVVTVNPDNDWLAKMQAQIAPDYLQLHGNESPARVREIKTLCNCKIIKVISITTAQDLQVAEQYVNCADILMFDSSTGGSGKVFDWKLLKSFSFPLPWFLSGGLTSKNVAQAIDITGAHHVDVSSGVESSPGVKDSSLIRQFIQAVKS